MKVNNFMEESKCRTYIITLEDEIKKIKIEIGDIAFKSWTNGQPYVEDIDEILTVIKNKYIEIKEQKSRIEQLTIEEQQILGTSAKNETQEKIYCSQCGNASAAFYKFFCKCGAPLR